jgi:hypothetical protein
MAIDDYLRPLIWQRHTLRIPRVVTQIDGSLFEPPDALVHAIFYVERRPDNAHTATFRFRVLVPYTSSHDVGESNVVFN